MWHSTLKRLYPSESFWGRFLDIWLQRNWGQIDPKSWGKPANPVVQMLNKQNQAYNKFIYCKFKIPPHFSINQSSLQSLVHTGRAHLVVEGHKPVRLTCYPVLVGLTLRCIDPYRARTHLSWSVAFLHRFCVYGIEIYEPTYIFHQRATTKWYQHIYQHLLKIQDDTCIGPISTRFPANEHSRYPKTSPVGAAFPLGTFLVVEPRCDWVWQLDWLNTDQNLWPDQNPGICQCCQMLPGWHPHHQLVCAKIHEFA